MIVCFCHGLTDNQIRACLDRQDADHCPAGNACGGCLASVREILDAARSRNTDNGAQAEQPTASAGRC